MSRTELYRTNVKLIGDNTKIHNDMVPIDKMIFKKLKRERSKGSQLMKSFK